MKISEQDLTNDLAKVLYSKEGGLVNAYEAELNEFTEKAQDSFENGSIHSQFPAKSGYRVLITDLEKAKERIDAQIDLLKEMSSDLDVTLNVDDVFPLGEDIVKELEYGYIKHKNLMSDALKFSSGVYHYIRDKHSEELQCQRKAALVVKTVLSDRPYLPLDIITISTLSGTRQTQYQVSTLSHKYVNGHEILKTCVANKTTVLSIEPSQVVKHEKVNSLWEDIDVALSMVTKDAVGV